MNEQLEVNEQPGRTKLVRIWLAALCVPALLGCAILVGSILKNGMPKWLDSPPGVNPAVFQPEVKTMAPGLHLLGQLDPSVAYAIETSEGLVLVDCGLESQHSLLLQQVETLGLNIDRLQAVLITHCHGDHYLGATHLRNLTGAKIYAGQQDSAVMRAGGPREAVFLTYPMDDVDILKTEVDVELKGAETLTFGDTTIRVIAASGHTPGSICYLMERDGFTALFSGDVIMTFQDRKSVV